MNSTLELHGAQTGNSIRAAIALEEAGLSYTPKLVDLASGAHQGVDHLALNPLGKVPVLVEKQEGRGPFILTQSNAIILYAAGKAPGRLLPENDRDRAIVLERFFFFVTDVIAVSHAAFSLRDVRCPRSAEDTHGSNARHSPRQRRDTSSMTSSSRARRSARPTLPASRSFVPSETELPWPKLPSLRKWFERIEGRPAVKRGLQVFDQP